MQVSDDRFQAESGCSVLTLLGSGHQKPVVHTYFYLYETYRWITPDDWQRRCPKHVEFYNRIKLG
jgi:hypothetical protein